MLDDDLSQPPVAEYLMCDIHFHDCFLIFIKKKKKPYSQRLNLKCHAYYYYINFTDGEIKVYIELKSTGPELVKNVT